MSTLRVSNIQDTSGGNTSTPAAIASGRAKAWININVSTGVPTARSQYNVSSIADNGVGNYTLTFVTGTFTDTNYAGVSAVSNGVSAIRVYSVQPAPLTATTCQVFTTGPTSGTDTSPQSIDYNVVTLAFFG